MTTRTVFDLKTTATDFYAVFNFTGDIIAGEVIGSASTVATCYSGSDASPQTIISGTPAISGKTVTQTVINGVVGTTYLLVCSIATSLGRVFAQEGYLVVVDAL